MEISPLKNRFSLRKRSASRMLIARRGPFNTTDTTVENARSVSKRVDEAIQERYRRAALDQHWLPGESLWGEPSAKYWKQL